MRPDVPFAEPEVRKASCGPQRRIGYRAWIAAAAVLLLFQAPVAAQPVNPPSSACSGQSGSVTASLSPLAPQVLFEMELTLQNNAAGTLHVDPGQIALLSDQGDQTTALTAQQAKSLIYNPGQSFWSWFWFGSIGYATNQAHQAALMKHVDEAIWTATAIQPGATEQGALFFKLPNPKTAQFALVINGLSADSGALPPLRVDCALPKDQSAKGAPTPPAVRTYSMALRAVSGPIAMTLTNVQFTADATSAVVTIENTSDAEANLFFAKGGTVLTDASGKSYALSYLKTTVDDRVPAHGTVRGVLVFDPIPQPPLTAAATLTMPNIHLGDAVLELTMEIHF